MTSVTPEASKSNQLRLYDLVPTPIQGALAKIGLSEKFFQTLWQITKNLKVPPHEELERLARPLEFLAASISAFVTVLLLSALVLAPGEEPIAWILKEQLFTWLSFYLLTLAISLASMHIDLTLGFFFPSEQDIKLSYADRFGRCAYIVGWVQFWTPAVLFLDIVLGIFFWSMLGSDEQLLNSGEFTALSERITTPLFGLLNLTILSRSGLINGRRVMRFSLYILPLILLALYIIAAMILG